MNFSSVLFVPTTKKGKLTPSESNIFIDDIEYFLTEIRNLKRGALNDDQKRFINNIFEISLRGIKSRSPSIEYHISSIWYNLMIKSISDVAQFASLIRNSHSLIKNQGQNGGGPSKNKRDHPYKVTKGYGNFKMEKQNWLSNLDKEEKEEEPQPTQEPVQAEVPAQAEVPCTSRSTCTCTSTCRSTCTSTCIIIIKSNNRKK